MHVRRILGAAIIAASGAATAAAADPIAKREALMWLNGGAMGVLVPMAKGEVEYDAKKAAFAFQAMNTTAHVFGDYFPEGSESTEGDFYPSAAVWEDREGFEAALSEFEMATKAAMDAEPADHAAFVEVFQPIGKTCGGCHEDYRVKAEN